MGHVLLQLTTGEDELGLAQLDQVTLGDRAVVYPLTVDERAVVATQIDDATGTTVQDQAGVFAGHERIGNRDIAVRRSAHDELGLLDPNDLAELADVRLQAD